ncbi:MAG: beta-ketoacyl-[acyl-carrier-protein] synthase family protein [Victivallaceae bacterium]|nr:beta-ketoacyl-[acyl-carrier-protein] synthase family protein [Victivallaceae bacterium]MDD4317339.1 beta-ketoacyl-[acyl-carrier-protein] synthase family protein [Victivallaceae bacterium]MDD5663649.1 beta-ketoacyl-[acyl-carrier-protein] synthase family protein [Victivallaceae bacterium]NLK82910.1 beta-ketoacyl-[acyl-carrier-protein] synthase family protein [Lentisphaerota bacterium]
MSRVFITGRGLITPLGNGLQANEEALRAGRSGTVFMKEWRARGLESQVAGIADEDPPCPLLDKKRKRFTAANARMAVGAVYEALQEANLGPEEIKKQNIAVIGGVAGSTYEEMYDNSHAFKQTGRLRSVLTFIVPRVMASSAVSNLSLIFGFSGESYDISSACSSSAHAILQGTRLIRSGEYDMVVCGGAEEVNWVHALGFMAMRALSRKYNDNPAIASRPFDVDRDGFVIAEGAGWMVLESEASVKRRNVRPICEITGYGANSNCTDMVQPDAVATAAVMRTALDFAGLRAQDIQYINTHGTATGIGDPVEMDAMKEVFGGGPAINSTKSMTGHMIGATGAVEAIYSSMMIEKNFICPSINLDNPEPAFDWADLVRSCRNDVKITHALSNSFAFGGTNVCLVFSSMER